MLRRASIFAVLVALSGALFAQQQVISIGSVPNDGTGDTLRTWAQKDNANFAQLFSGNSLSGLTVVGAGPSNVASITDGVNWCSSAAVGACWLQTHLLTVTATQGQTAGAFLTHSVNGSGPTALGSFGLTDSNSGNAFASYHEAQIDNVTNPNGVGEEIDCKNQSLVNARSDPQTIARGCKALQVVASSQGLYGGTATNPVDYALLIGTNYSTKAIASGSVTNASSGLTPGTYANVPLTCVSGTCNSNTYGSYATATITVGGGGTVSTVAFTGAGNSPGDQYSANDILSAAGSAIGGAGATSTFQYTVATVGISYQNAQFNSGIIIAANSLANTAYGYQAIQLATGYLMSWWSADAPQFTIESTSTTVGDNATLNFADNSLNLLSPGNTNATFKEINVLASGDTTGNYPEVVNALSGGNPQFICTGPNDTNVSCTFAGKGAALFKFQGGLLSAGTKFTATGTGACGTITTTLGGAAAGSFLCTGSTGASTITITINGATGDTAPNGWACSASDITAGTALAQSGSTSTTACTISGTITSNDKVVFQATGY